MKVIRLIQFFFITSIVLILGEVFSIQEIRVLPKLVLVPLMFLIYFKSVDKIRYSILPLFILCFVGEISTYFDYNNYNSLKIAIVIYGIMYLLLIGFSFKLIKERNTKRLLLYAIPIILLWLVYYEYYLEDTFGRILGSLYYYILGYSITLGLFNVMANVSFFNEGSQLTLYLIIVGVVSVIGDVLLSIYLFGDPIELFKIVNVITNIIAYFFILKFAISYTKQRARLSK